MSETLAPQRRRGRDYTHSTRALAAALLGLILTACTTVPPEAPPPAPAPAPAAEPVRPTPPPARPVFTPAPRAPATHTVVKGDTLWDISAMFLSDPWKWPEIWKVNPQIENPHLIYPGDVITLTYDADGRPMLSASRDGQTYMSTEGYTTAVGDAPQSGPTVKVAPQIRTIPLADAIPTIATGLIRPFLSRSTVIEEDELKAKAYVMRPVEDRLLTGAGDRIYVRGMQDTSVARYTIVRVGKVYRDPDTRKVLGHEAMFVGEGVAEQYGDPGVLRIESTQREVQQGDKLLAGVGGVGGETFVPRGARAGLSGRIIDVVDGVGQIGQFAVVVLNRGGRDGVANGDVFTVFQSRGEARDETRGGERRALGLRGGKLELPEERAGELMVFRAYDRVSYALVMRSSSEMHVGDIIRAP